MSQLFLCGIPDSFHGPKCAQQSLSSCLTDSRNIIKQGAGLRLRPERPVILDREAVCLILNAGDQLKTL